MIDPAIQQQVTDALTELEDTLDLYKLHTDILSGQVTPDVISQNVANNVLVIITPQLDATLQPYVDSALAAAASSLSSANDANTFSISASNSAFNAGTFSSAANTFAGSAAASSADANNSAYAASVSATFAATSSNSSANFASAAQASALVANTKAAEANTSANAAFISATQASSSANSSAASANASQASALSASISSNNALSSAVAAAANAVSANTSAASASANASLAATFAGQASGNAAASLASAIASAANAVSANTSAAAASANASLAATYAGQAAGNAASANASAVAAAANAVSANSSAAAASANATLSASFATSSAANASSASTSAGQAAANAASAASSATAASANAVSANSSAASAASSAILSAQVSAQMTNRNATFADWSGASGTIPPKWQDWASSTGNNTKAAGLVSQNAFEQSSGALTDIGILTLYTQDSSMEALTSGQSWIFEIDVTLVSGTFGNSGIHCNWYDFAGTSRTSASFGFASTPDSTGVAPGAGVVGNRYKFNFYFDDTTSTGVATRPFFYLMTGWSAFGSASSKTLRWHKCGMRPATGQEIEARAALSATTTLTASVSTLSGAVATLDGKASAYLTQVATAGSAAASVRLVANSAPGQTPTSSVQIQATEFALYTGSTVVPTLKVVGGKSEFTGILQVGTGVSGARVQITDNLIQVFDANNTLRVRLGLW